MAERDFENLLKVINQTNTQLEITNRLINDLVSRTAGTSTASPISGLVRSLEDDVRRLQEVKRQAEAGSLREISQTRQGAARGAPYGRVPGEEPSGLVRNYLTNFFQKASDSFTREAKAASDRNLIRREPEINALGRDAATRLINQIQNELLQGAIQAREAANRPISAGLARAAGRALYDPAYDVPPPPVPPAPRPRFRSQVFPELYPQEGGQLIPGGFGSDQGTNNSREYQAARLRLDSTIRVTNAQNKYADSLAVEVEKRRVSRFDDLRENLDRPQTQQQYEDTVLQKGTPSAQQLVRLNRQEQLEQAERDALNSVRNKIQTERRYASVLEAATRQGFTLDDLAGARTKGTAGIEEYRFRRRDSQGVQQDLSLFNAPSGRTTAGISNQFRTFGQGVVRDIGELTKWSIALAAVYGPMRQLQELTQRMIENQTRLAEATVSVSSSFIDQADIFNIAADSAEFAGESISGVIDAFTQAYRAAGGTGNEVERLATAQNLLNDALILSKLSTLDQTQAIDTLSAAVRQTGGDFGITTELLDSWVRVTKVANVDLATLSTGFAVLGDAAEAAGFDMDELNGLIALIAESSQSSGQEVANAARAIVGGLQSDQGVAALENLGIATKTTTGELRSLEEILLEVSGLIKSGVIDPTQLSELGQQIGGGVRRGAIVTTVLSNYSRAQEVAAQSSQANGDAQAALAKQLETVQTSLTRLGNAFDELAQTLGTEGGFLGIITSGVDSMTSLVNVFENLTGALGKATPALAAFIATSLILKSRGQGGISQILTGYGQSLTTLAPEHARLNDVTGVTPASDRFRQGLGRNVFGTNARSGGIQGLALAAIPALLNLSNTDDRFRGTKAAADAAGGLVGGIVGALAGPQGAIIGSTIGIAIAEAFVNSTIARSTNIFGYTQAPTLQEPGAEPTTTSDLDQALEDARINLYKDIGGGSESAGLTLTAGAYKTGQRLVEQINKAIEEQDEEKLKSLLSGRYSPTEAQLQNLGLSSELITQGFEERRQIQYSPENIAFNLASDDAQRQFREAEAARLARGGVPGREAETAFSQAVTANNQKFDDLIDVIKENSRQRLSQDRLAGDVTGAEYGRRTEALGGFDVRAVQYYTALGNEVSRLSDDTGTAAEAFEVLNNVIVFGAEDALPQITSVTGEIQELMNLLNDPNALARLNELFPEDGIEGAKGKLEELQETLANLVLDANQAALLSQIDIPNVQGDITKPLTQEEFGVVEQRAKQLQDQFYEGFLQIPDDMYDALKGSFEEWAQIVEDSGETFFRTVSEIDPQFFQQAMQQLLEENRLASQASNPFGIQQLDITSGEGGNLQSTIDYFSGFLSQNFPQYEQNPEQIGVIFSDYVTAVLHGDNLAIKLALDSLNDKAQKQLDGQYNIPEGATFWVPLTAAYYRPENQGGMGGLPAVDSAAVDGNTSATDRNTQAIDQLNLALQNEIRRGQAPQETRERYLRRIDPDNLAMQNEARRAEVPEAAERRYNLALTNEQRRAQVPHTAEPSFLQRLENFFRNLFNQGGQPGSYRDIGPRPPGTGGFGQQSSALQVNPQVNARLELAIDNNTQLIVDGRVLASIVSPYLAQEMVRLEAASGTVTRRYVI